MNRSCSQHVHTTGLLADAFACADHSNPVLKEARKAGLVEEMFLWAKVKDLEERRVDRDQGKLLYTIIYTRSLASLTFARKQASKHQQQPVKTYKEAHMHTHTDLEGHTRHTGS